MRHRSDSRGNRREGTRARRKATCAVGLNRSAAMLQRARARYPSIGWIRGDITSPPLQGPFDLVLCALNTLQMLPSADDVLRMFKSTHSLHSTGRFAFDLYNPSVEGDSSSPFREEATQPDRRPARVDADGKTFEVHEDAMDDPAGEWVELDWRVVDTTTAPPKESGRLEVRWYVIRPRRSNSCSGSRTAHRPALWRHSKVAVRC